MLKKTLSAIFICSLLLALLTGLFVLPGNAAVPTYQMSAAYQKSQFFQNFAAISLTGDEDSDVLSVALSQLGYHEGDSESDLHGTNLSGSRDFAEYNVLYGKLDNDQGNGLSYGYYWCASFVNWCLRQAGVDKEASCGAHVSCWKWLEAFEEAGRYSPKGDYTPRSGDLIFFKDEYTYVSTGHVGLVLYTEGTRVYTIEGNTSNGSSFSKDGNYVALKSYLLTSPYIVGYGSPDYAQREDVAKVDYSGNRLSSGQYISKSDIPCYKDPAMQGEKMTLPAHVIFQVKEVYADFARLVYTENGTQTEVYGDIRGSALQVSADSLTCKLSFTDQGKELLPAQYLLHNSTTRLSSERPTKKNAGFRGWSRAADGSDELLAPGVEITVGEEDLILYAVWDETFYLISFKTPDGNIIAQKYGYYGDRFEIPAPTELPEGMAFSGWDRAVDPVITGDATYTAVYVPLDEVSTEQDSASGSEADTASQATETEAVSSPVNPSGCSSAASLPLGLIALLPLWIGKRKEKRAKGSALETRPGPF